MAQAMKILKLHSNSKPVLVNANDIQCYCYSSETGKVFLVTHYEKGLRLEVDEALWEIQKQFDMGKKDTDEKGD